MLFWYIFWPIFVVALLLVIDRLVYGDWYWQFEYNLFKQWKAVYQSRKAKETK